MSTFYGCFEAVKYFHRRIFAAAHARDKLSLSTWAAIVWLAEQDIHWSFIMLRMFVLWLQEERTFLGQCSRYLARWDCFWLRNEQKFVLVASFYCGKSGADKFPLRAWPWPQFLSQPACRCSWQSKVYSHSTWSVKIYRTISTAVMA